MAQQKPGVMLYFEMRNVFEELSNEKRGILLSAILDYSEHGIQPDFRGSLRIAWASIRHKLDRDDDNYARKSQVRRYAVYIRESKKDGVLPLPYEQWLASLPETSQPETSNDTNRYPTTTTTATATTTATSTDCCYMPAAGKPPRQPQRLIPPTVEEVRAYAAQRGDPPEPTPTAPVGEALSLPKCTQLSRSLNGSSFPTQTVGADTLIRVLAEIRGFGRILSAPTEGVCHAAGRFGNGDVFIG